MKFHEISRGEISETDFNTAIVDSQGGDAATVDLKRQHDMRPTQAVARMWNQRGLTDQSTVEDEIKIALKEVG